LLAETSAGDRQEIVVAELSLACLREFRVVGMPEFNRALHDQCFPRAYEECRAWIARNGKRFAK
jgi:hypothetical protein